MSDRVHLPMFTAALPSVAETVHRDTLVDNFARRISYLRVSITDRCNFRCAYCMPNDSAMHFAEQEALLSFAEIARVVAIFTQLGVHKVRLTGGEPTVRAHAVDLVAQLAALPRAPRLVMTSNGHRLPELAVPLAAAGLRAVNISLDSVDPTRFARLSGNRGQLSMVIAGIDAAIDAGLAVKLNAVALATDGDDPLADIAPLCEFAWMRGLTIRFIEPMPMSAGQFFDRRRALSAATIRGVVSDKFGALVALERSDASDGPARYWHVAGGGTLGIISAVTEHFCDDCNRLRLTATGELHACLGFDDALNLRDLMRAGATDGDLVTAIAGAVSGKRLGHDFQSSGLGGPTKHMIAMGG